MNIDSTETGSDECSSGHVYCKYKQVNTFEIPLIFNTRFCLYLHYIFTKSFLN